MANYILKYKNELKWYVDVLMVIDIALDRFQHDLIDTNELLLIINSVGVETPAFMKASAECLDKLKELNSLEIREIE